MNFLPRFDLSSPLPKYFVNNKKPLVIDLNFAEFLREIKVTVGFRKFNSAKTNVTK